MAFFKVLGGVGGRLIAGVLRFRVKGMADMGEAKINFAATSWDEPGEGVRSKVVVRDGKKLRVVEFTDKFIEHDWCMKGHIGYVLDGDLEIHFPDRVERFTAGDGIMIKGESDGVIKLGWLARL